jgi:hypothetical protein
LIDTFYQEVPLEDAKARLHRATSYLRSALEPGISAKRESGYLKAREGFYQLVLPDEMLPGPGGSAESRESLP